MSRLDGVDSWPQWPMSDVVTERLVTQALRSNRWAISGSGGRPSEQLAERIFAGAFADFCDAEACVPVSSGSSALLVSLQSLGLNAGDQVLIPAITWVACATAVLRANLQPVLIDMHQDRFQMNLRDADEKITERTRVIMMVHLYSTLEDVDGIHEFAKRHSLTILEDAAHAHGASWQGRRSGSLGDLGCFSMQDSKLLTSGEGGAVTTSSARAAGVFQLRADGRDLKPDGKSLRHVRGHGGSNHCMSEVQAAILRGQLLLLPERNDRRHAAARFIDEGLQGIDGVDPAPCPPAVTERTYYQYAILIDRASKGNAIEKWAARLTSDLGISVARCYAPLYRDPLLLAEMDRMNLKREALGMQIGRFPGAEALASKTLLIHHRALLASSDAIAQIAPAIRRAARAFNV